MSADLVATRDTVRLSVAVADSAGPLAAELVAAYEQTHPWVSIDLTVLNSAHAEAALRSGGADLALLSWLGDGSGDEIWSVPWVRDGILVIMHPSTRLPGNSLGHLQEVFRGRLQEWEGDLYAVVTREEGSGTRSAFEALVMGYHSVTLNAAVVPSNAYMVETVAETPNAIGYVSSLRLMPGDLERIQVLRVDGAPIDARAIADGAYVLWRQLYLATEGEPEGPVRELAQWLLGPEAQAIRNLRAAELGRIG